MTPPLLSGGSSGSAAAAALTAKPAKAASPFEKMKRAQAALDAQAAWRRRPRRLRPRSRRPRVARRFDVARTSAI
eukprot:996246-Alexandrium_andersonii.AAC.1